MSKRPDSLETLQLSHELLRRIPKGRTITASELHQQLKEAGYEREMRTIQRQLETLSEFFDIDRDDSSKPYRYCWKEQAKGLSLSGLSAQESLLLMLAEQQLSSLLPARLMKSMEGFFDQAHSQLGFTGTSQREREWLDKVRVVSTSQPLLPPKVDHGVFAQVSNALYDNQWLDVVYQNANGKEVGTYRVMPLGLVQQGQRMYLACRFEGYNDNRSLALHRIKSATASTLPFVRPKDFDLQQLNDDMGFGDGPPKMIRLQFRIDKANGLHILECPLSADQTHQELPDWYVVTATVADTDVLGRWLNGFGDGVSKIKRTTVKTKIL
jgi:predicted DNA-binding transcriptional regulator YafY